MYLLHSTHTYISNDFDITQHVLKEKKNKTKGKKRYKSV